jgi:hypothetical protein
LAHSPTSFLSLIAVPIAVAAVLSVLTGGNSRLLRNVAVVTGIAVAGITAAIELDLVNPYDIGDQVHLGIVPACLLSLGLFGSAVALGQASIRSAHR